MLILLVHIGALCSSPLECEVCSYDEQSYTEDGHPADGVGAGGAPGMEATVGRVGGGGERHLRALRGREECYSPQYSHQSCQLF